MIKIIKATHYKKKTSLTKIIIVTALVVLVILALVFYLKAVLFKPNTANVNTLSLSADANGERINLDTILDVSNEYTCGHTKTEQIKAPPEFLNKTKEQIEQENPNVKFTEFSSKNAKLRIAHDTVCDSHFVIKIVDDKIKVLYKNDLSKVKTVLGIDINALPTQDREILKNGIEANSEYELLQIMEDLTS